MTKKIPVYEPVLSDSVRANVLHCIDSNWISSKGEFIDRFEREFASRIGIAHAASVCNGTVALHLALLVLGIGPGDEVIVPTFTYVASVNAIRYVGATPVFADSRSDSWQVDPVDIERRITSRTRAVMPVHLYGQPCDMPEIMAIARKHDLKVIEDAAEAFGSYIGSQHAGSWGDVTTFSFFGNKTITTGEGGAVVTQSPALDAALRKLRGQGLAGTREYWHDVVGYNYRMTNIAAAIGVGQLEMADELIARKRAIAVRMREKLAGLPVDFFWEMPGTTSSFWMNTIGVHRAEERDPLRAHLAGAGIETRPAFYPAHTMPMYTAFDQGPYPVATQLAARGINLPSSPALSNDDVDRIAGEIAQYFARS
jgi:perosamine synthetase